MSEDRFLLIKNWSFILWADVEHALSQLLIAELTKRIPVIFWPTHCLHNGFVSTNGFELYFESVSPYTIFDIAKPEYTYYPPIWDSESLLAEDMEKETWAYRNIGDMMCSKANVIVGDVYCDIYNLIPFIKKDHPAYGMTVYQIKCYLFRKYIRIKQDIDTEIQGFFNSWLKNEGPILAVHVLKAKAEPEFELGEYDKKDQRYHLKKAEKPQKRVKPHKKNHRLLEANKIYHKEIKKYIEKYNVKKIFLMTNCEETLKEYHQKYGSMLIYTQCKRIPAEGNQTFMENPMIKRRRGMEVIKDTYIASKCDFFIGSDFSSGSHAVTYIRDWPVKNVKLLFVKAKNLKYPVNVPLIVKEKSWKLFRRLVGWLRKLLKLD